MLILFGLRCFEKGFSFVVFGVRPEKVHQPLYQLFLLLHFDAAIVTLVVAVGDHLAIQLGEHLEYLLMKARLLSHLMKHLAPVCLRIPKAGHVQEEKGLSAIIIIFLFLKRQVVKSVLTHQGMLV